MSNMDFGDKIMIGGLTIIAFLVVALISSTFISNSRSREYELKCTNAGGIHLKSSGQDFCIKEFLPLGGDKK